MLLLLLLNSFVVCIVSVSEVSPSSRLPSSACSSLYSCSGGPSPFLQLDSPLIQQQVSVIYNYHMTNNANRLIRGFISSVLIRRIPVTDKRSNTFIVL